MRLISPRSRVVGGLFPPPSLSEATHQGPIRPATPVVGGLFPPPSLSVWNSASVAQLSARCGGTIPPTFIERPSAPSPPGTSRRSCGGTIPPTFIERTDGHRHRTVRPSCGGTIPPTFIERSGQRQLAGQLRRVVGGLFPPPSLSVPRSDGGSG